VRESAQSWRELLIDIKQMQNISFGTALRLYNDELETNYIHRGSEYRTVDGSRAVVNQGSNDKEIIYQQVFDIRSGSLLREGFRTSINGASKGCVPSEDELGFPKMPR
jgi:hypothetical protein